VNINHLYILSTKYPPVKAFAYLCAIKNRIKMSAKILLKNTYTLQSTQTPAFAIGSFITPF